MTHWDDLAFSLSDSLKGKTTSSDLVAFVTDLCEHCRSFLDKKLNKTVPSFEFVVCSYTRFRSVVRSWSYRRNLIDIEEYSASLFSPYYKGLAIDLEQLFRLVEEPGIYNFIVNLTLACFDGLIHLSKPEYPKRVLNDLADLMTVEFLEIEVPEEAMGAYERTQQRVEFFLEVEKFRSE